MHFSKLLSAGLAAAAVSTVIGAVIASSEPAALSARWRWKAKGVSPPKRPTDKPALSPVSDDAANGPAEPSNLDARADWGSTPDNDAPDTSNVVEKRWFPWLHHKDDSPDATDAVDKRAESALRGRNRRGGPRGRGRGRGRNLGSGRGYAKEEPRTEQWYNGELKVSDGDDAVKKRDASPDQTWTLFSDSEEPVGADAAEKRSPDCHYPVVC